MNAQHPEMPKAYIVVWVNPGQKSNYQIASDVEVRMTEAEAQKQADDRNADGEEVR